MFKSHLISMVLCAFIVSTLMAFINHDKKKEIFRYALKLFIYLVGGVIIFSWLMHFL